MLFLDACDCKHRPSSGSDEEIDLDRGESPLRGGEGCAPGRGTLSSLHHVADELGRLSGGIAQHLSSGLGARRIQGLRRGIRFASSVASIGMHYMLTPDRCKHESAELREAERSLMNKRAASQVLNLILSLKGYYIKAAQTLCGAGQFPPEFDEAFAVLLDQCPSEPYDVVRKIIEDELNCSFEMIFSDFDQEAIAAASIGQVHFATLRDGTKVAVKVQYPEVERFFQMDVDTVALAMRILGMRSQVEEVFKTMQSQFAQEFDYTQEAAIMREVAETVTPCWGDRVQIPLPIDGNHPACPTDVAGSLCTRKVLVMERLEGVPIRKHVLPLLEMFAQMYGTTVDVLKHNMNQKDPSKIDMENKAVRAAMEMNEVSETRSRLFICAVKARNCMVGVLGQCLQGCCQTPPPEWTKKKWAVPLNGPRLAKLLFDVHGHQMFRNGLFNSDPHAGNVLMMPDGRLGLVDFGATQRLTEEQRTNIALLLVAVADEDDAAVPKAFWDCGFQSKNQDPRLALLLAHVFFNRGPWPYDMNRLAPTIGMPQDVDIVTLDKYIRGGKLDDIKEFPGHMVMLQRCCMVLSGIGMELGAGRLSSAGMLKPQALQWLRGKGLAPLD